MIFSTPIIESAPPKPITVLALAFTGSNINLTGANPSLVIIVIVPLPKSLFFFVNIYVPSGIITSLLSSMYLMINTPSSLTDTRALVSGSYFSVILSLLGSSYTRLSCSFLTLLTPSELTVNHTPFLLSVVVIVPSG